MAIDLGNGISLGPVQKRRIGGRTYSMPLVIEKPATKQQIQQAVATISRPKKKVTVLDTIGALGIGGLAKVYVSGGAYGSKEAVKTTFTEVAKAQGLPTQPLIDLWKTKEFEEWQPKAVLPIVGEIPSIQIDPAKPFDLGLPSWEELKKPLLIAGIVGAGLLLLPSIIGAFKK